MVRREEEERVRVILSFHRITSTQAFEGIIPILECHKMILAIQKGLMWDYIGKNEN
jgi:hypothetical protein